MPTSSSSSGQGNLSSRRLDFPRKSYKDVMGILNYGEESVSVAIKEVKSEDWLEKVYEPDIRANWAELYKKPGYGPSDLE